MATAVLSSCLALPTKFNNLSLNTTCSASSTCSPTFKSLSFSTALSHNVFNKGCLSMSIVKRPIGHSIVCEAAPKKKTDSAEKRARQAEKRRIYNKARKSEVRTRMKKCVGI